MNKKFSHVFASMLVKKSHKGMQEAQLNKESVNDKVLILTSHEEDQGWYLENDDKDDETDEILKSLKKGIQAMESYYSVKI